MEMHSPQSLYEIHGISIERRRRRSRPTARLLLARIVVFLTRMKLAITAELAIRRAMTELAEMDDHMLRDLGIHRSEIKNRLRLQRANIGTDEASIYWNIAAQSHPNLPIINSPLIASEARPEQGSHKLHFS